MARRITSRLDSLRGFLNIAACVVSVLMLLSFPATRFHNFPTHFRNPEVRRSTERHTAVAPANEKTQDAVAQSDLLPRFFAPIETAGKIVPAYDFQSISQIPPPHLLNRQKLNPSGSGPQDPLLPA
jgi:hypothetical protein